MKRTALLLFVLVFIAIAGIMSCSKGNTNTTEAPNVDLTYSLSGDAYQNFSAHGGLKSIFDEYLNDILPFTDSMPYTAAELSQEDWKCGIVYQKNVRRRNNRILNTDMVLYTTDGGWPLLKATKWAAGYLDSLVTVGSVVYYKNPSRFCSTLIDSDEIRLIVYRISEITESDLCTESTPYEIQKKTTYELVPVETSDCN